MKNNRRKVVMMLKKYIYFLPVLFVLLFCSSCEKNVRCTTEENCINDPKCLCWCSQICKYRKKNSSDKPHYVENDPNGKYCYCKQWDLDHYEDNCIFHKNIKEPKDAD